MMMMMVICLSRGRERERDYLIFQMICLMMIMDCLFDWWIVWLDWLDWLTDWLTIIIINNEFFQSINQIFFLIDLDHHHHQKKKKVHLAFIPLTFFNHLLQKQIDFSSSSSFWGKKINQFCKFHYLGQLKFLYRKISSLLLFSPIEVDKKHFFSCLFSSTFT